MNIFKNLHKHTVLLSVFIFSMPMLHIMECVNLSNMVIRNIEQAEKVGINISNIEKTMPINDINLNEYYKEYYNEQYNMISDISFEEENNEEIINEIEIIDEDKSEFFIEGDSIQAKFLNKLYPYAIISSEELEIPFEWILAHWAHESGYGTSNRARNHNNYAGIMVFSDCAIGGRYNSIQEFNEHYIRVMKHSRYNKVKYATDITDFALRLRQAGYATDPNYHTKRVWNDVLRIIENGNK